MPPLVELLNETKVTSLVQNNVYFQRDGGMIILQLHKWSGSSGSVVTLNSERILQGHKIRVLDETRAP